MPANATGPGKAPEPETATGGRPLVSVIMANFDGAAHLAAAIASVQAQTVRDIELLVADDASRDGSTGIVTAAASADARVRLLTATVNAGPAAARNRALAVARGDWIAIVDSDDLVHPERFARLLALARSMPADMVADDLTVFPDGAADGSGKSLLGSAAPERPVRVTPAMMLGGGRGLAGAQLGYLKPMIRRARIGDLRYREDVRIGEDHEFYMRLLLGGARMVLTPQSYYRYRRHPGSISHRLSPGDLDTMIRVQDELAPILPECLRAAAARRRRALQRMRAYEAGVAHLKARRPSAALGEVIRRPGAIAPFLRLAARHLVPGLRQGPAAAPAPRSAAASPGRNHPAETQLADRAAQMTDPALVHVRTPTYRRPEALRRCLESLVAQTHDHWICDVFDDDPHGSAAEVVAAIDDPRIRWHQNRPQRFASLNIDMCFSRDNPQGADYFCVVEDDNYILPRYLADNIALCRREGVEIVLRNQIVEHDSGTPRARLGTRGILDDKLSGGLQLPDVFRMSLIADIGVSNGGLFWSRDAVSDLQIHEPCSATLQEYLRTFAVAEPIWVALEPLAVWAENGEATQRDVGALSGYIARELALKRSVGILQRLVWEGARSRDRDSFLTHPAFRYPTELRARGLVKSHIQLGVGKHIGWRETARLALRGALIRLVGRPEPGLRRFLSTRRAGSVRTVLGLADGRRMACLGFGSLGPAGEVCRKDDKQEITRLQHHRRNDQAQRRDGQPHAMRQGPASDHEQRCQQNTDENR